MAEAKPKSTAPDPAKDEPAPMTAAQAAKRVFRPPEKAGGKPVPIKAAEVLSHRDYGTHVVVVTEDGKKFSSAEDGVEGTAEGGAE